MSLQTINGSQLLNFYLYTYLRFFAIRIFGINVFLAIKWLFIIYFHYNFFSSDLIIIAVIHYGCFIFSGLFLIAFKELIVEF